MKKLLILYPFLLFCLISKADNQLKLTNWEIKSTTEISENAKKYLCLHSKLPTGMKPQYRLLF